MENYESDREEIFSIRNPKSKIQNPKSYWRSLIGVLAIATVIILYKVTPLGSWLNPNNLRSLKDYLGIWAALGYVAIYALATVLAVPGSILTLSGGALFGAFFGTLWTAVGATLGATGAFLIARFVAGWAKRFEKGERLRQLSQGIAENGFWFVLSIRLSPIFPFVAINYLLGLTPIPLPTYITATAIGILPGTFAYVWLGSSGLEAVSGRPPWQLIGALTVLALLSALPLILKLLKRKTTTSLKNEDDK